MRKELVSDQELVKQYMQGDEESLRVLINRHKSQIYSTIYLLVKDQTLAEDVFQETFMKVVNTLKRGKYAERGKFLPWVIRIARNLVIDHFRKTNKMPTVTDGDGYNMLSNIEVSESNHEDEIIEGQNREKIRDLIQTLPEKQREVLVMRQYAELSFKEIAEITNVSINTALGRMRYALINMRKMLEKNKIYI